MYSFARQSLQVQLIVNVHMKQARGRGGAATLPRLREYCQTSRVFVKVTQIRVQCLYYEDTKAGGMVRRPFKETLHGARPGNILYFDHLYINDSRPFFLR